MALGTIATIATIAAAATSVGVTAYSATQKSPTQPDGASSSRKVAQAQADALPYQLQLQQLMQQGGKGVVDMPAHTRTEKVYNVPAGSQWDYNEKKGLLGRAAMGADPIGGTIMATLGANKKRTEWKLVKASEWEKGGSMEGQPKPPEEWSGMYDFPVPAGPQEVDFTGFGTADIEGNKARKRADLELTLGQKYGVQFAEEARKAQEQADPLGTKARALEAELIKKDMPVSPLSGTLDSQLQSQLGAGRGLDPMSRDLLDQAVAQANASRGGQTGAGEVANSMATGAEGQARLQAALDKSKGFLASGETPEDIAYKRAQQKITNTGAFVNGATPQSQFGAIGQAGKGAAPVSGAQPTATMANNAGQVGQSYATTVGAANAANANTQSNNWFAGLSSLLSGIGSLKTAKG
jgi:hypothetical protein